MTGDDGLGSEPEPVEQRRPETPFEESAASWVPPWARAVPELVIEPAADDPPLEFAGRRWPGQDEPSGQPEQAPDQASPLDREPQPGQQPEQQPQARHEERALPDPDDYEPGMTDADLRSALEAIMLVVDEPVTGVVLAQVLEEPRSRVEATLSALAEEYAATGRGFELRSVAGGWRLYTRGQYADYVERFVLDGQQVRLTQAALETLAVVAYKQPVTRSRVSAIRGVNSEGVIKTLVARGLVEECGTEPESGAHLYRTTPLFLEKLGLNSVEELPSLAPFLPDNVDDIDIAQR